MGRRTRKDKQNAVHHFSLSWSPEAKNKASVKRQIVSAGGRLKAKQSDKKNALLLAKEAGLASIKKDLVKSLILSSLILTLEVVLYLAWPK